MSDKEVVPIIPKDIINFLDNLFPTRCPDLDMPERKIWFKAGQRSVVEFLMSLKDAENELPEIL